MNNHPRTNYLYQFTGKVLKKRLAQASPQSKYSGQAYYVLTIQLKDHTRKSLQVFRSKLSQDQIWTAIEQGECLNSHYLFLCRNQKGYYYLVDWEKKPSKANDHDLN
jgi:hypothetical protein